MKPKISYDAQKNTKKLNEFELDEPVKISKKVKLNKLLFCTECNFVAEKCDECNKKFGEKEIIICIDNDHFCCYPCAEKYFKRKEEKK